MQLILYLEPHFAGIISNNKLLQIIFSKIIIFYIHYSLLKTPQILFFLISLKMNYDYISKKLY